MRGIFWWSGKKDRSWEAMEKSTSPFRDKRRKRPARKGAKREKEYPKLRRTVKAHDERFDPPSSEIVGILVVCLCIAWIAIPLIILLGNHPLYAVAFASPGVAFAAWVGIRWKRRRKAVRTTEEDKPQDSTQ
jgi:Flp pilus assembly protein TadB